MKVSEFFPTKYVEAADLQGHNVTVTIRTVTLEAMRDHAGQEVQKLVVWFENRQKGFVLNKTNALTIAKLHGNDTDDWIGQKITLYPTRIRAFGEMVDAIRVRDTVPAESEKLEAEPA